MGCYKVKELTRTFQEHVAGPWGSSMVLRYDGSHVMQQLLAHLFGTIFYTSQSQCEWTVLHRGEVQGERAENMNLMSAKTGL
jgi:hypothetical protein